MKLDKLSIEKIQSLQKKFLITGLITATLSAVAFFKYPHDFAISYLLAYMFWIGLTLGCFPFIFIHFLTWGNWGLASRRLFELGTKQLPIIAILFIPILFNMHELYEWTHPDVVAHDPILLQKSLYLNSTFFCIRLAAFFAIWFFLSYFARKWSSYYDKNNDQKTFKKMMGLGGFGLLFYSLTVTLSSVDWVMSLEPHWFSTIYGVIYMIGNALTAFAFTVFMLSFLSNDSTVSKILNKVRNHDLGTLLFALIMLWAYMNVSQLIIMWSGNLQEEAPWYMKRVDGGWHYLATAIFIFHFLVPFFVLIVRKNKEKILLIGKVGLFLLVMRYLDLLWFIKPAKHHHLGITWIDLTTVISIGSFWLWFYFKNLQTQDISFSNDPELEKHS